MQSRLKFMLIKVWACVNENFTNVKYNPCCDMNETVSNRQNIHACSEAELIKPICKQLCRSYQNSLLRWCSNRNKTVLKIPQKFPDTKYTKSIFYFYITKLKGHVNINMQIKNNPNIKSKPKKVCWQEMRRKTDFR